MADEHTVPPDPLAFIRRCVSERRIYWTYHVHMRMEGRHIPRTALLDAVATYEVIEAYPDDKYLPSYLVYFEHGGEAYHAVFATDIAEDHVRVVTVYRPDADEWTEDRKRRMKP